MIVDAKAEIAVSQVEYSGLELGAAAVRQSGRLDLAQTRSCSSASDIKQ